MGGQAMSQQITTDTAVQGKSGAFRSEDEALRQRIEQQGAISRVEYVAVEDKRFRVVVFEPSISFAPDTNS